MKQKKERQKKKQIKRVKKFVGIAPLVCSTYSTAYDNVGLPPSCRRCCV